MNIQDWFSRVMLIGSGVFCCLVCSVRDSSTDKAEFEEILTSVWIRCSFSLLFVCLFYIKDPDAGKGWKQEEKGTAEDEMVGWHHRLNGHKFEQALGVGDGQGSLACCSPWSRKESDTTEWLNWLTDWKNLPAIRETWVWSLGWEDLLEEGVATHSSILAWRILMNRGAWQVTVHGVTKSWTWLSD